MDPELSIASLRSSHSSIRLSTTTTETATGIPSPAAATVDAIDTSHLGNVYNGNIHNKNSSIRNFQSLFASSSRRHVNNNNNNNNVSGSHRMDPSSAMHRLRVSMLGGDDASQVSPESELDDDERLEFHERSHEDDDDNNANNSKEVNQETATLRPKTSQRSLFLSRRSNNFVSNVGGGGGGGSDVTAAVVRTETVDAVDPSLGSKICSALGQIPAIALIGIFHLMIGIPFGVSYFPMDWGSDNGNNDETTFPLPAKEAVGIRMFLFATMIGQVVFTFQSGFANPIGLQMVENIGFTKELSNIVIAHQGFGIDALVTLMVVFGLSSVLVGLVFLILGKLQWGSIVHFFPTHVLIGCIGGIGILICRTGLEVTVAEPLSVQAMIQNFDLWIVALALDILLRFLEWVTADSKGRPRFALLSPIFFCMITPTFYLALWTCRIPISTAAEAGYFFPPLVNEDDGSESAVNRNFGSPWDIWKVLFVGNVSWAAVWDTIPTMIALILFSLIHVPINIPAFALSTKVDIDMNQELVAHGYSNLLSGLAGGLQNYMAYTQSVLYHKSGGTGRVSGIAVAMLTGALFFVGPTICSYLPRCMAGTLLLHVGIDLFLEGVWDSVGRFDLLEYGGIWLITVVMTIWGMEAAMVAGFLAAVSTYVVQNVAYLTPIRGFMSATTLRSSHWNRSHAANQILDDPDEGRSRILVVQLQGHIFFGNTAYLNKAVYGLLDGTSIQFGGMQNDSDCVSENKNKAPLVLIFDCSLVLGIDSSAAAAMVKLKDKLLNHYHARLCLWVSGTNAGFPTEYRLSDQLNIKSQEKGPTPATEDTALLTTQIRDEQPKGSEYIGSRVCESLDIALMEAEDSLIARINPSLVYDDNRLTSYSALENQRTVLSSEEEKKECIATLKEICPAEMSDESAAILFSMLERETYSHGEFIWRQNEPSDCFKILIDGQLLAELENEAGTTEIVVKRSIIGELGLINGDARMSSVRCTSNEALLFSMSRESFEKLVETNPALARVLDLICIKYLALRVQHVSNRIFETRCLPV